MKLIILLLVVCSTLPHVLAGCSYRCPTGWNTWGGRCYKYFANKKTGDEAQAHCRSCSSHLTSINSGSEQSYVYNLWQTNLVSHTPDNINVNTMNSLWIGAKRVRTSVSTGFWGWQTRYIWTWTWTDGSSWTYSNWENTYGNQPDNTGNCAHMWTHSRVQPPGGWNDLYCDSNIYKAYYVCERSTYYSCTGGGGGGGGRGGGDGGRDQLQPIML